jgi:sodium-dependent dicarboxylate transporter 2/3/5
MPVVALLPLLAFPLLGLSKSSEVASAYANPIIFLFMGGFLLALSIEKWSLHRRIALNVIRLTGNSGNSIILGFTISSAVISMWLSNTATTMMMFPIALSVIKVVEQKTEHVHNLKMFSLALMLMIAYSANIGGMATLIGTPPNVAYAGHILNQYRFAIPFGKWMLMGFPISFTLVLSTYWIMVKWLYPNKITSSPEVMRLVQQELNLLGKLNTPQKRAILVFACTALGWILKDLINLLLPVKIDDAMVAIAGATLMFLVPAGGKSSQPGQRLLNWDDTAKMAWGILIMFGGGMALANQLEKANLMTLIGGYLADLAGTNMLLLLLLTITFSIFLSEFMSNVAQVLVLAPVVSGMADALQLSPLLLGIPMTLAASCSAMMPMGTPPNAIVFASGHIPIREMIKAGFVVNLLGILIIFSFSWWLLPWLFNLPLAR